MYTQWYSIPSTESSLPRMSLLPWWPTLSSWEYQCTTYSIDSGEVAFCCWSRDSHCKPWFHGPSLGGALHMHGLWERCLCSVFPDLHGQGSLAQHKCGWSWPNSSYVTLIFYSLDWTSSAAKCLCWSFIVLNTICSQMTPYMALWGIFKICNFVLLVVAAA